MEQPFARRAARPRPTLRSSLRRSGVAASALAVLAALCSTVLPGGAADGERWSPTFALPRWFGSCPTGGGIDCVVDGDTFWIGGEKVRIADIDAPETHPPRCEEEARLGNAATRRLQQLLNGGPISLVVGARNTDRYGRRLRMVVRNGRSLGDQLISEGLARPWTGRRRPWCDVLDSRAASSSRVARIARRWRASGRIPMRA